MSSKFLYSDNTLYNSDFCRLCGERNSNGELLYNSEDEENALNTLINRYLPVKVKDDGRLPRTICPGCHIQLQATVQFFDLLILGQKRIRILLSKQERDRKMAIGIASIPEVEGEDGNIYMMITVPNEKEALYPDDDPMSLQAEGLEKPRKKRGRPRKQEEVAQEPAPPPRPEEPEVEVDADGRVKRRRKVPQRYLESVAGPEMDRIFKEHGVIDEDEKEKLFTENPAQIEKLKVTEIIGRTVSQDGTDLGELVVLTKSKNYLEERPIGKPKRKLLTCGICKKSFANRKLFQVHKVQEHGWKFVCGMCNSKFYDKTCALAHQASSGHEGILEFDKNKEDDVIEEIMDPMDFVSVDSALDAETAEGQEGQEVSCPACQKTFISLKTLMVHMKAVHEGLKPYKCTKCPKAFAFPRSLGKHLDETHGVKEGDESLESADGKQIGPHACNLCEKKFQHLSSLFYHKEAEHNEGVRFACNKCDKTFKHRQLLQRHQLVHTEDRPFICTLCTTSFKTKANLTNHMLIHTGEKKYFCDLCGQQFAHKTSLVLHHRWHNGDKPYQCKFCKKNFSQNGNLQEHLRIHTGEKPYICSFCGRSFTTSSQFKLHVKRHTGERPWKCDFCAKTFLHKDTWKCHVRRHKGEKPYSCEYCQRGFTEHWALRKHVRIHTGEKPYVCEICNKAFADCSNLNKHKKVHRGLPEDGLKVDGGEGGMVLQLMGEEDEDGTVPVIYVAYNQQTGTANEISANVETEGVSEATSVLQQISQGEPTGLVLSTEDGQEVVLNTLGGDLPMVVPEQTDLQLAETVDAPGATLQMQSGDDGMSLPVTLAVEDGQLVAHIPNTSDFLKDKDDSGGDKSALKDVPPVQFQLVTQDGRAVQLISNATDSTAAFSIDFTDEN
ncbi:zinc finger protein 62 homolog isoform X2 [Neocloeon triangulifer]|uniref:zinc finger protein 62 homolog isoform X2 n=1 Tax=Neocloeon triangulifer TaxID=2078957 RepID=UPI00286F0647|nr:zinc finger protein 62 homolog isoform X2 [Neocloeon triangulifer]